MNLAGVKITGRASASGTMAVPIGNFPLLAHQSGHPKFGDAVFLEDGSASVPDVVSVARFNDHEQVAAHLGTTPEHVQQALAYAQLVEG